MKKKTVFTFFVLVCVMGCKKVQSETKSEGFTQEKHWQGAYGIANNGFRSFDSPISLRFEKNGSGILVFGSGDPAKAQTLPVLVNVRSNSLHIKSNDETKRFEIIGTIENDRFEGTWTNGENSTTGVIFLDIQNH